jgi:hypothetical protein
VTTSSGKAAVDKADAWIGYDTGMCLQWVRGPCWGLGSLYGSAIEAWNGAKFKHPGDRNPPIGAPLFYSGGSYGHIVIAKPHAAGMRSTDCTSTGRVGDAPIEWIEDNWPGRTYLGWTEDLNGVRLPLGSDTNPEGDDMPHYDHGATSSNTRLPAGTWITVVFTSTSGDDAMTAGYGGVKIPGRTFSAVLHVTVTDADQGATVKMRTVEDTSDGRTAETNPTTEALATPGETAATHAHNGYCSDGRVLRFQVLCTEDATLSAADAVVLSWD